MDGDKAVTATFESTLPPPTTFTLTVSKAGSGSGTVTSEVVNAIVGSDLELGDMSVGTGNDVTADPAGISCGSDCSENYESGTVVSLTAMPASGSTFAGWSGACTGIGTCLVTMDGDKAVTATFSQETSGSLNGTWQGPYRFVVNLQGLCNNLSTLTHSGTLTMVLTQSGTSFSGSGNVTGIKDLGFNGFGGCFVVNNNLTGVGSVSGTLSGQSVTGQISFSAPDDLGVFSFSGTLSGNSISNGTLSSPDGSGTFSATKQ